jgi:hypothetical protein
MRAFRVTSDPDLPCRRVRRVIARSSADAARRAVVDVHDFLTAADIEQVERATDRGAITHVVTVSDKNRPPSPLGSRFDWLRCEGVWFWCPCIVKEIRTAKEQRP